MRLSLRKAIFGFTMTSESMQLSAHGASSISCVMGTGWSHTLAGSETPDSVSLLEVVLLVVFLVQSVHLQGDHVLIPATSQRIRRALEKSAVRGDRCRGEDAAEHQ